MTQLILLHEHVGKTHALSDILPTISLYELSGADEFCRNLKKLPENCAIQQLLTLLSRLVYRFQLLL